MSVIDDLERPAPRCLPDPFRWAACVVAWYGECRSGRRAWFQLWPLLDLPVIAHLWPQRDDRQTHPLQVVKVHGQQPSPMEWELVVLVYEGARHRAVAVRVEAAARIATGHPGPPGPRLVPVQYLGPQAQPEAWLVTALHLL